MPMATQLTACLVPPSIAPAASASVGRLASNAVASMQESFFMSGYLSTIRRIRASYLELALLT